MKQLFTLLFSISVLSSFAQLTKLSENHWQYELPYEIIEFYINIRPGHPQWQDRLAGMNYEPGQQEEKINTIIEEIERYGNRFAGKYLPENIFFCWILEEGTLGYHYDNLVVLHPNTSKSKLISTFHHELAHHIAEKKEDDPNFDLLLRKLEGLSAPNHKHRLFSNLSDEEKFETGWVSEHASSDSEEDFCEIYSHLMHPAHSKKIKEFVHQYPKSVLSRKIDLILDYLGSHVDPSFNRGSFGLQNEFKTPTITLDNNQFISNQ